MKTTEKNLFLNKLDELINNLFPNNPEYIIALNNQDLTSKLVLIRGFADILGKQKIVDFCNEMANKFKLSL